MDARKYIQNSCVISREAEYNHSGDFAAGKIKNSHTGHHTLGRIEWPWKECILDCHQWLHHKVISHKHSLELRKSEFTKHWNRSFSNPQAVTDCPWDQARRKSMAQEQCSMERPAGSWGQGALHSLADGKRLPVLVPRLAAIKNANRRQEKNVCGQQE